MKRASGGLRPLVLAVLSGAVTALTSAVAYFVLPLVRVALAPNRRVRDSLDAAGYVLDYFFAQSPLYHFAVLVLVPFATTVVGLTVARRAGHVDPRTGPRIMVGVVAGPVLMVWVGAAVALVAIAFQALAIALYGFTIAIGIALVLSAGVAVVVTVSALCGYTVAERIEPLPQR